MTPAIDEGGTAPDVTLETVDGDDRSLATIDDADALVVGFATAGCEKSEAYVDRIRDLAAEWSDRGVAFRIVDPDPADGLIETLAKDDRITYLLDPDHEAVEAYGPSKTPHLFCFDGDGRLLYDGRFDDAWRDPERVMRPYVEEALEVVFGERDHVEQTRTLPIGSTI